MLLELKARGCCVTENRTLTDKRVANAETCGRFCGRQTKIWQKGPDLRRRTSANAHHDLHVAEIARRQKVQTRQISGSCLGNPGPRPRAAISVNFPEFCTNCMSLPFVQDLRCPYGIPISCGHNM